MMGDGVIDFAPLCAAVEAAGYTGDIEVEIFNADVWAADPDEVLDHDAKAVRGADRRLEVPDNRSSRVRRAYGSTRAASRTGTIEVGGT